MAWLVAVMNYAMILAIAMPSMPVSTTCEATPDVTILTGLYSVPWNLIIASLADTEIGNAPALDPVLQRAFNSGYLEKHDLVGLSTIADASTTVSASASTIAAILPSKRRLPPSMTDAFDYTWPNTHPLHQLLRNEAKHALTVHVFDSSSILELLNHNHTYAFRHLHALLSMQLTMLLENTGYVCYSWKQGKLHEDASAIEAMLETVAALPTATLRDMCYTSLRPILLAMLSACQQPSAALMLQDDPVWTALQPRLQDVGIGGVSTRAAQLFGSSAAMMALHASYKESTPTAASSLVFFAGLEGTGHHLWGSMLSSCRKDVCGYNDAATMVLTQLSLMHGGDEADHAMKQTRGWYRDVYTRRSNPFLFFNAIQETHAGELSFPSYSSNFKWLQYPDMPMLQTLATQDWKVKFRAIVLLRDPAESVASTIKRRFDTVLHQIASLELNSRVLLAQLISLPPSQWVCWDFNAEHQPQCAQIAQHLGLTPEQLDLCAVMEKGHQTAVAQAKHRFSRADVLGNEVLKQMEGLYSVYLAIRQLCKLNAKLRV
eukprot:m.218045 g.218045  ORF g.218045 m.218045 type:complete len:546 (-) comp17212_c0_seq6:3255-4892(-)